MILNYYCDGAATMKKDSKGNYIREAGGWAFICLNRDMKEICRCNGGEDNTTNNRMELMAIFSALNDAEYAQRGLFLNDEDTAIAINIYSDSAYCINIFTQWIKGWESRGWKKSDKKPIENLDLILAIWHKIKDIEYDSFSSVNFIKVKGHDNVYWNEEADKFAVAAKRDIQNKSQE